MIYVASYCRVSTNHEDQANSFESQQRYFKEYIEHHRDWVLYEIYADEGITGTSTKKRTQFNRMIRDAHAGKFQMILTKEISRFSRNILDTISYTRELKSIGIGVLFMTENLNTMNPESEMLLTFMGTIAQEESRRTSIRVKWGQTRRMEQGIVFGRSLLGYDVKNGQITIKPKEAALVRLIFCKYGIEKKGTSVISRELQEAGYRTASGNLKWNASHIIKILRNEKYVGDLIQKKTITPDYLTHLKQTNHGEEELVYIKDHHEPIISRELWDIVQAEMAKRNKHGARSAGHSCRYVFSGKIKCGECGASFVVRYKKHKNGTKTRRWSCYTAVTEGSRNGCDVGKLIRDDDALNMLKTAIRKLSMDREAVAENVSKLAMEAIAAGETGMTENRQQLQREIAQIALKKKRVMDAYFSEEISIEEMRALKFQYDEDLAQLQKRMEAIKEREDGGMDFHSIRMSVDLAVNAVLSGDLESEGFYRSILDSITVFKDRHLELRLKSLPQIFQFTE